MSNPFSSLGNARREALGNVAVQPQFATADGHPVQFQRMANGAGVLKGNVNGMDVTVVTEGVQLGPNQEGKLRDLLGKGFDAAASAAGKIVSGLLGGCKNVTTTTVTLGPDGKVTSVKTESKCA